MYRNEVERIQSAIERFKGLAIKSRMTSAEDALIALNILEHTLIQNKNYINELAESGVLSREEASLICKSGKEHLAEVVLKETPRREGDKHAKVSAYIRVADAKTEETGAAVYQVSLYPEMPERVEGQAPCCYKVKSYTSMNVELSNYKAEARDGKLEEVAPAQSSAQDK